MKVFKTRKAYFIKMLVTMVSVFSGIAVISSLYIGYSNYQALHNFLSAHIK